MNLSPDPMGAAEARAMLDKIPELYFAVLRNTYIEQSAKSEVRCSFELPVLGKRTKTAPTTREAIREVLIELANVLTAKPTDEWPKSWTRLAVHATPGQGKAKAIRFQAKARQFTLGVTMPVTLKSSIHSCADKTLTSFADVARRCVSVGFEDFDERSFSEASESLLAIFSSEVSKWLPSESEQVMVRLDQHLAVRLRSAAKEYSRSASEFGAMCLAHGAALQTQFADIEKKVAAYRGPAIRKLAPKVGLGEHAALLSGILAGSTVAPKKLLGRLSGVLEAPESALTAFFKQSFESRAIPSFKASGKPQLARKASSWEEVVRSLKLPAEDAKSLLQLDE